MAPYSRIFHVFFLSILLLVVQYTANASSTLPSSNPSFVLRLRFPDGSVERVGLDDATSQSATLQDVLARIPRARGLQAKIGSKIISDDGDSQPLRALGLRHGSLLTLTDPASQPTNRKTTGLQQKKSSAPSRSDRWDPFPEIAKQYHAAKRQASRKKGALSYGDLAKLQSELHVVQAQPDGPIQRIYMCRMSAEALATAGSTTPKAALLLGTIQRERKDQAGRKKARTSLSSTTADEDFVTAAKVHALWQPTAAAVSDDMYNSAPLLNYFNSPAHQVATWLGIHPVGWIFTYPETNYRHDNDGLPVWGPDVQTAAQLQILNMKRGEGRVDGARFVTLAMDGKSGATEAFQLSDVAVQMTAEGVLSSAGEGRFMNTTTPVLVDGKESHTVDSVLCLVNTALLSHEGLYADGHPSAVKKTGGFTKKVKKRISNALLRHDDTALLQALCNFSILVSLTERLTTTEAEHLVTTVRKFARGQKKSTKLDMSVKQKIGVIVES